MNQFKIAFIVLLIGLFSSGCYTVVHYNVASDINEYYPPQPPPPPPHHPPHPPNYPPAPPPEEYKTRPNLFRKSVGDYFKGCKYPVRVKFYFIRDSKRKFDFHTTYIVSGLTLIVLGALIFNDYLYKLNQLTLQTDYVQEIIVKGEELLKGLFME